MSKRVPHPALMGHNAEREMQSTNPVPMDHNMEKAMHQISDVVLYKEEHYVFLGTTPTGRAILANLDGTPYKGNPALDKLIPVPASVGHTANDTTPPPVGNNAGNPGKETAMPMAPVTARKGSYKALPTFAQHLAARRLESPLAGLVPSLSTTKVIEAVDERFPDFPETAESLPLLFSWGAIALYGASTVLTELTDVFELGANIGNCSRAVTADSIRKYIGSLFAAAHVSLIDLSDLGGKIISADELNAYLKELGLPEDWCFSKAMDGEVIVAKSLAAKLGWEVMKDSGHNAQVRRIMGPFGLIKGKIRILDDADMPPGITIIACEIKGEIKLKVDKILAWQPGFGLATTKTETITSTQAQLHILGNEIRSKAHLALTGEYFANLLDRLPAILEGAESKLATADQPAGRKLQASFNKVGLSVLASSQFAKSVAGTATKLSDPRHLQVRPTTATGSQAWKVYPATSIFRVMAAAWLHTGNTVPAHIQKAVDKINTLPVFTDGKPNILVQNWEEWVKGNENPHLIVMYRSPSGPTSGTVGNAIPMPEELKILDMNDDNDNLLIFGDSPEFWGAVDSPNEGADRDDSWRCDRDKAAEIAIRGLAWRAKLLAKLQTPEVQAQIARLNDHVDAKLDQVRSNPDWSMPHAQKVYGTVFDIVKDKETKKPVALRERQAPEESALTKPRNKGEEIEMWRHIWGGEKSPFESAVGQIANAQKWAMALAVGLVELPSRLAHLKDAIVFIIGWAVMLSDVIDAAGKGRGYEEAHNAVTRMAKTMLWLSLHAYTSPTDSFGMAKIGVDNAGEAFRALMVLPKSTYGTGRYIGNQEIYAAKRDKDGNVITAVQFRQLDFPLHQAHLAFHAKVGRMLSKQATTAWSNNVQGDISLVLGEWLSRPEVTSTFGADPITWVASAYHNEGELTGLVAESKMRFASYRRWLNAAPRNGKAINAKLAWVREPNLELLSAIRENGAAMGNNPDICEKIAMLAYSFRFGFTDLERNNVTIEVDPEGGFEVEGGLPSQALSGNREGNGPGDILAGWLALPETVAAVAKIRTASSNKLILRVGPQLRHLAKLEYVNEKPVNIPAHHGTFTFSPAIFVGKTAEEALKILGISIAQTTAQQATVARLGAIADAHHETSRNRVKNACTEGKITTEERKDRLAHLAKFSALEKIQAADLGTIMSRLFGTKTAVSIEVMAGNTDKTTYEDNFLVLRFGADEDGATTGTDIKLPSFVDEENDNGFYADLDDVNSLNSELGFYDDEE